MNPILNLTKEQKIIYLVIIISSMLIGLIIGKILFTNSNNTENSTVEKPSYWVAPMDPNYKSDKPGKSPMGMDLIPFYENKIRDSDMGPGTITISPDIVNNLGVRTSKVLYASLKNALY